MDRQYFLRRNWRGPKGPRVRWVAASGPYNHNHNHSHYHHHRRHQFTSRLTLELRGGTFAVRRGLASDLDWDALLPCPLRGRPGEAVSLGSNCRSSSWQLLCVNAVVDREVVPSMVRSLWSTLGRLSSALIRTDFVGHWWPGLASSLDLKSRVQSNFCWVPMSSVLV